MTHGRHRRTDTVGSHVYGVPGGVAFQETESRLVGARGWGRACGDWCLGTGSQFGEAGTLPGMDGGDGRTACECTYAPERDT